MIGRFIELALPTEDILRSIGFYEQLGFRQLTTGDMWPYAYAVVSDGDICVGLHESELPGPLLSFVLPELATQIDELRSRGLHVQARRTGSDEFNEVTLRELDRHRLRLVEARTFSPPSFGERFHSACGQFRELALPVRDLDAAQAAWQRLGFDTVAEHDGVYRRALLQGAQLALGLHETGALDGPALVFTDPDLDRFETLGFALELDPDLEGQARLRTPEGLDLLLGRD